MTDKHDATESTSQPEGSNTAAQQTEPQTAGRKRRFRWRLGVLLLACGAVGEVVVWKAFAPDRTMQVFASLPVLFGTLLLLVLWWLCWSGLSRKEKAAGLVVTGLALCVLAALVRVEGFEGAMIPRFTWRWSKTTDQLPESYWKALQAKPTELGSVQTVQVSDSDWPGFRGPRRDGVVRGVTLRTDWDERPPKRLWRHAVGLGWCSFAVADGLAFTLEQRGQDEVTVCYQVDTGKQVWAHHTTARFSEVLGGDGPRATPLIHDGRVYSLGAEGHLNCLDAATGQLVWSRNILKDAGARNLQWGMAASPLAYKHWVIVVPGGRDGRQVIAYDCRTGEIAWTAGSRRAAYSAPRVETVNGVTELLVFGGDGLSGFDPETGRELWFIPWPTNQGINVAQPILYQDKALLIGSGYGRGTACFDLVWEDGVWKPKQPARWHTTQLKLKFNDAVLKGDFVYGLDEGILACLDVRTGKRRWKHGRFGYGQLLLVGDCLLVQAEDGAVVLVEATPERFREVARFQAIEGKTWNHPVLWRGRLLVRNSEEAACYSVE